MKNYGKEFVFQARIAICKSRKVHGKKQHAISAVMIAMEGQEDMTDSTTWENIQCEIIIRPIQSLGTAKLVNMRLDHAALALSDETEWEKKL